MVRSLQLVEVRPYAEEEEEDGNSVADASDLLDKNLAHVSANYTLSPSTVQVG